MQVLTLESEQASAVYEEIISSSPVLLVGSAISTYRPTQLLTGKAVTHKLSELLFSHGIVPRATGEYEYFQRIYAQVPFEHVFERCPCLPKILPLLKHIYAVRQFNPIHQAIAKALNKRRINGLITTNYDVCLDAVLSQCPQSGSPLPVQRVVCQSDLDIGHDNQKINYFKIHGSADDTAGETLVFSLRHESLLPAWKRELLHEMLDGRSLLVIGYSGLDFEICPEILKTRLERLWWNELGPSHLSYNATRLLEAHNGLFLQGDLRMLCSALFSHVIAEPAASSSILVEAIAQHLNKDELMEWRLSLANSMGCPNLVFGGSRRQGRLDIGGSRASVSILRQQAQALFHLGRYNQSARRFGQAIEMLHAVEQTDLEARLHLDRCEALRCHGSFLRAYRTLRKAEALAESMPAEANWITIRGRIALRKVFLLRPLHQLARMLHWHSLEKLVATHAEPWLRLALRCSAQGGAWFDFQQARFWAERLDIDLAVSSEADLPTPPPPKEGYDHLGYHVAQSMYFRDLLQKTKPPISPELRRNLTHHLDNCQHFGNFPEIWKLLFLLRQKDRQSWNWTFAKRMWRAFFTCEYRSWMRLFQLLTGG